jgi:hypothetical protein
MWHAASDGHKAAHYNASGNRYALRPGKELHHAYMPARHKLRHATTVTYRTAQPNSRANIYGLRERRVRHASPDEHAAGHVHQGTNPHVRPGELRDTNMPSRHKLRYPYTRGYAYGLRQWWVWHTPPDEHADGGRYACRYADVRPDQELRHGHPHLHAPTHIHAHRHAYMPARRKLRHAYARADAYGLCERSVWHAHQYGRRHRDPRTDAHMRSRRMRHGDP